MKILVTGAAGFIGSHVSRALLERGHELVCVDNMNSYYDPALKEARLAQFKDRVTFYEADIADLDAMTRIFSEHVFDKICHLAAQAGVRYSLQDPFAYARSNYAGTQNIFELAHRNGSPHIVFASSSSVYGLTGKMPFEETDACDKPVSIYAASKRATELLGFTYHSLYNMDITALRFFTVYGPWGRPDMALFSFTEKMQKGEPIEIYNNGDMKRDFTFIDDIVQGFVLALEKPNGFQIYNLGRGNPVALGDFVAALEEALGIEAVKVNRPMQLGDVKETYASVEKAKKDLGYEPKVDIQEGIRRFVEWYRSYHNKGT